MLVQQVHEADESARFLNVRHAQSPHFIQNSQRVQADKHRNDRQHDVDDGLEQGRDGQLESQPRKTAQQNQDKDKSDDAHMPELLMGGLGMI